MADEIGKTILEQLGGARMAAMIGVKHALTRPDGVGIRFKAAALDKINHLEITLEPSDTYRVEFWRIRSGLAVSEIVKSVPCVYADQLVKVIEGRTGLRLSL